MPSGDVLLTSFLLVPPNFLNVTSGHEPGRYLFGYPDFRVRDVRVAGLLHRSFAGAQEDLVLGVISVLLIALLSEIVQTVLMRTRRTARANRVSPASFNAAFMIDEASHFRNVCGLFRRDDTRQNDRQNSRRKRLAVNSLLIVLIAVSLLAAEVIAVYLTQPYRVYTTKYQYNLRGVQPAGTSRDTAVDVDLLTSKKRCVTPSMMHSNQSREYSLSACVMRKFERKFDDKEDAATFVEVASWFHEAGSDHRVTFGVGEDTGMHEVSARASIMQGQSGVSKGVLFDVRDGEKRENANYLQRYMIYTAMQWNCEQDWEERTCMEMKKEMTIESGPTPVKEKLLLWEKKEQTREEIEGVKIKFKIKLRQPFVAVQNALHVFTTSAVIEEVEGRGMYVDMNKNEKEDGVESLVSEEGRIAGVVLLSAIFFGLLLVLIILRCCLKPLSLARIARNALDDDMDLEMQGSDFVATDLEIQGEDFVGTSQQISGEYPLRSPGSEVISESPGPLKKILSLALPGKEKGKERVTDLTDFASDDYESTMTTEGGSASDSSNSGR